MFEDISRSYSGTVARSKSTSVAYGEEIVHKGGPDVAQNTPKEILMKKEHKDGGLD